MDTMSRLELDSAAMAHQIRCEGGRAARLMGYSTRYKAKAIIVLPRGVRPTLLNLLFRRKAQAFELTHKGTFLLDASTGQPYRLCWNDNVPYCVPIDVENIDPQHQQKLLRRIKRRIHECL
jgi:hypothetical protein